METSAASESEEVVATSRRPMNAFLLFCKRHRGIVKEKYPNLENRNITKILGEWWQSLTDGEKSNFNTLANEYKEHVKREQPNFRWRKPPPASVLPSVAGGRGGRGDAKNGEVEEKQPPLQAGGSRKRTAVAAASSSASETSRGEQPVAQQRSGSNSSSNSSSSSPEPSLQGYPSAAPKPFKKRFLAAETAKMFSTADLREPVSPDAEHACKALLELAGVRESSPTGAGEDGEKSKDASNGGGSSCGGASGSRSGTSSPPNGEGGGKKSDGFYSLRDAVWSRVAKTLLKQEEEKGSSKDHVEDAPLNLSSQCTIRGQTIIEHIIENILDEPLVEAPRNGEEGDGKMSLGNLNNNAGRMANGDNGSSDRIDELTADEIKQRIYQSLKEDILKRPPGIKDKRSALWELLPHYNITTVSITGNKKEKPICPPAAKVNPSSPAQPKANAPTPPKPANPPVTLPTAPAPIQRVTSATAKEVKVSVEAPPKESSGSAGNSRPLSNRSSSGADSDDDCARDRPLDDDTSTLNIKNLLAQSPAPPSPRSKNSTTPTSSLTNALIASVLENRQQPVELLFADHKRPPLPPVSVTLVRPTESSASDTRPDDRPVNLSKTPPQTPSVSLTPVGEDADAISKRKSEEEEEEEIRRSSRACKGKRYQEFKDEGRLGQRKGSGRRSHKSGDSSDNNTDGSGDPVPPMAPLQQTKLSSEEKTATTSLSKSSAPTFDVTARLNAIPALSLESYQQKVLKAKAAAAAGSSHHHHRPSADPSQQQQQQKQQEEASPTKKIRRVGLPADAARTPKDTGATPSPVLAPDVAATASS